MDVFSVTMMLETERERERGRDNRLEGEISILYTFFVCMYEWLYLCMYLYFVYNVNSWEMFLEIPQFLYFLTIHKLDPFCHLLGEQFLDPTLKTHTHTHKNKNMSLS